MRPRALLLALPLLLAGCGGHDDKGGVACATIISYTPNAAYTGPFFASYAPTTGTTGSTTFNIAVSDAGVVSGTATDASGAGVSVTGTAADYRNTCDDSKVAILLDFTPTSGAPTSIVVYKKRNGALPGSYSGFATSGTTQTTGTLTVNTPPLPG